MTRWADWQARWQSTSAREQRLLLLGLAVVVLALTWWLVLAPALRVIKAAPAQHLLLDSQLERMQQWQTQAQALRAQPALKAAEAKSALEASLQLFGAMAQMTVQLDRVSITLKGVGPPLAQWLATVRQNARLTPTEAHLQRNAAGTWDGTLVLTLPGAP